MKTNKSEDNREPAKNIHKRWNNGSSVLVRDDISLATYYEINKEHYDLQLIQTVENKFQTKTTHKKYIIDKHKSNSLFKLTAIDHDEGSLTTSLQLSAQTEEAPILDVVGVEGSSKSNSKLPAQTQHATILHVAEVEGSSKSSSQLPAKTQQATILHVAEVDRKSVV